MSEDLKTAANWAKELKVPEKKLKEAIKVAEIQPDSKKGACTYYSKATIDKALKIIEK